MGGIRIGVAREAREGETRVALVPEGVRRLVAKGASIVVEEGAGVLAGFSDPAFREAGAEIGSRKAVFARDLVAVVEAPPREDAARLEAGAVLVGLLRPRQDLDLVRTVVERRASILSFDLVPRISRAQSMDVLSSMATIAGYRAALIGAEASPRFFPMLMTAAGTIRPATVLVIGAGVAGLQAIATAHRLGAVVLAFDLRPAVKEQVESLGARFVELDDDVGGGESAGGYAKEQSEEQQRRQSELLADKIADADVVITTAQVPGRPAPRIIDAATVRRMKRGSVVVDVAAEAGGNCELTQPGERVETDRGVVVLGPLGLPATMPAPASQMLSRNLTSLLGELVAGDELVTDDGGKIAPDLENEVIAAALAVHAGEVRDADVERSLSPGGES